MLLAGKRENIDERRFLSGKMTLKSMLLLCILLPGLAAAAGIEKFDPIPIRAIYPPVKPHSSADEALASGHVANEYFKMAKPASKPWRIAFLFPHMKDPYWIGCSYGVISEARRLGVAADIFPAEGYDDLIGQLREMDEAIASRYDAIVISPVSMTANNASIAKARKFGIPVFELANDSTSDDLTTKVTTSLKDMGIDAARWVIEDARRRGLRSINIALLPGPLDAGWVKGEVEGTLDEAKRAPIKINIVDIEYGDSDRILQARLAAQLIARYGKELDYIIGCTGCAPAARLPINEAKLDRKIRVVAYDLTREIADLIERGEIQAAADTKAVSQARVVLDSAVNFLEGRTRKPPDTILIRLGLVDQSNYASYPFDTSIGPKRCIPVLSYAPKGMK